MALSDDTRRLVEEAERAAENREVSSHDVLELAAIVRQQETEVARLQTELADEIDRNKTLRNKTDRLARERDEARAELAALRETVETCDLTVDDEARVEALLALNDGAERGWHDALAEVVRLQTELDAAEERQRWPKTLSENVDAIDATVDGENVILMRELIYQLARERDEARAERDGAREAVDDLNRQMKCVTHTWPDCGGTCDFPCKPRVADTHPEQETRDGSE